MERARLMYDEREECVCASSTRRSQSGRRHVHVGHRGLFPGCPSKTVQAVGMERGTFVVWGGLQGFYLSIERILVKRFGGREIFNKYFVQFLLVLTTYLLVNITWVFFRAQSFPQAFGLI